MDFGEVLDELVPKYLRGSVWQEHYLDERKEMIDEINSYYDAEVRLNVLGGSQLGHYGFSALVSFRGRGDKLSYRPRDVGDVLYARGNHQRFLEDAGYPGDFARRRSWHEALHLICGGEEGAVCEHLSSGPFDEGRGITMEDLQFGTVITRERDCPGVGDLIGLVAPQVGSAFSLSTPMSDGDKEMVKEVVGQLGEQLRSLFMREEESRR